MRQKLSLYIYIYIKLKRENFHHHHRIEERLKREKKTLFIQTFLSTFTCEEMNRSPFSIVRFYVR